MDKLNFIREGMTKLPPGFRFQPTDEELVFEYLKRKILSWPLPASVIPDVNVCKFDPWDLPGDMEQDRYFFSNKEAKYRNGNRINRATGSGYWKAAGADRQIASRNNAIGMKKTLVFYRGKAPNSSRTDWIMHEYRLVSLGANNSQNCSEQLEKWVLCRIFLKKKDSEDYQSSREPRFNEFMRREEVIFDSAASSSDSNSNYSSITDEVSSSGKDFEFENCYSSYYS